MQKNKQKHKKKTHKKNPVKDMTQYQIKRPHESSGARRG